MLARMLLALALAALLGQAAGRRMKFEKLLEEAGEEETYAAAEATGEAKEAEDLEEVATDAANEVEAASKDVAPIKAKPSKTRVAKSKLRPADKTRFEAERPSVKTRFSAPPSKAGVSSKCPANAPSCACEKGVLAGGRSCMSGWRAKDCQWDGVHCLEELSSLVDAPMQKVNM